MQLRQFRVFTATASGCVSVTDLLTPDAAPTTAAHDEALRFIQGAAGLRTLPAARACLRRLVAAVSAATPPHTDDTDQDADDSEASQPSATQVAVRRFLDAQHALMALVPDDAQPAETNGSTARHVLPARDPVCVVPPTSCHTGLPVSTSLWQPAPRSDGAVSPSMASSSSSSSSSSASAASQPPAHALHRCGVCVTCEDLAGLHPAGRHVF